MNPRLLLLTLCQNLFLTNNVTFIAINGLVGLSLAPRAWMATLPITGYVAGGALCAGLVAKHQRAWGRKRAFQAALCVAMLSSTLCAYAAFSHNFTLLVASTLLAGYYNANAGLYRFAATEIVTPAFKERAISWVLAGGILGAVAGPNLASATRDALLVPFAGAYAARVGWWIGHGQNAPISGAQLSNVLGPDAIGRLAAQVGLSHDETAGQLSQMLPEVIHRLTPNGEAPSGGLGDDMGALLGQLTAKR